MRGHVDHVCAMVCCVVWLMWRIARGEVSVGGRVGPWVCVKVCVCRMAGANGVGAGEMGWAEI